jgi:hypothetical protein
MISTKSVPIVGTVGVPARYGGFETLAEQLCRHISSDDVGFVIYCERNSYNEIEQLGNFFGHRRIFLPLRANGISSIFYDSLSLIDAVFRIRANEILIFGYSGAFILPLIKIIKPRVRFIVNVDGMEWRRDKFSLQAKLLLKVLEWCAVRSASVIIADNVALAEIFCSRYGREPVVIAYGGDHAQVPEFATAHTVLADDACLGHYLAIARIEPENNTEMIIRGCVAADVPLVFIGNWTANAYGIALRERYSKAPGIRLLDPIYDQAVLASWRSSAIGYIHGHSVGGTNPSLVEALFSTDRLASFDCSFNRATLLDAGAYFSDADSLAALLRLGLEPVGDTDLMRLRSVYRWDKIAACYRGLLHCKAGE